MTILCLIIWAVLGFVGFILATKGLDTIKLDFDKFSLTIQVLLVLPSGPIVWAIFLWILAQEKLADSTVLTDIRLKLYKKEYHSQLLEEKERMERYNKQLAVKK